MKSIAAAAALVALGAGSLSAQSLRTISSGRQRTSEKALDVSIEFAAGTFSLRRDATGALYHTKLTYIEDRFRPVTEYDDGDLHLGLKSLKVSSHLEGEKREYERQAMDVALSPDVPAQVNLKFAAGNAEVDLGGMNLTSAEIHTGASQSRLTFSSPTTGECESLNLQVGAAEFHAEQLGNARCRNIDFVAGAGDLSLDFTGSWGKLDAMNADIKFGVGSLKLAFPTDIGVEVQVSRIFSSFDHSGFVKRGGSYYSGNWETAKTRLHVDITAALGSVEVAWR
jgi:hypothetical protein